MANSCGYFGTPYCTGICPALLSIVLTDVANVTSVHFDSDYRHVFNMHSGVQHCHCIDVIHLQCEILY